MKKKIQKQIEIYTEKLNALKKNQARDFDVLSDEELDGYKDQILMTAEFIRVLKELIK